MMNDVRTTKMRTYNFVSRLAGQLVRLVFSPRVL